MLDDEVLNKKLILVNGSEASFTKFQHIILPIHYSCKMLMRSADFRANESEKRGILSSHSA